MDRKILITMSEENETSTLERFDGNLGLTEQAMLLRISMKHEETIEYLEQMKTIMVDKAEEMEIGSEKEDAEYTAGIIEEIIFHVKELALNIETITPDITLNIINAVLNTLKR